MDGTDITLGTCPDDIGLASSSYEIDFTKVQSQPSDWTLANYEYVKYGNNGAEFTFSKRGDAPTMWTNFKFFYGHIDYVVQAAQGQGIVSSMVLLSDDLDEIDWEATGTRQNYIETNYFGKGFLNYDVATYVPVSNLQYQFHTYSLDWSPSSIVWSIDGVAVRTLMAADAGQYFPQTPMKVSLSLWDGGDPDEAPGTMSWAGGETPIPPPENYTMFVKSVKIQNANPGHSYHWTDKSGSSQSIKVINDTNNPATSSAAGSFSSSMSNAPAPPSSIQAMITSSIAAASASGHAISSSNVTASASVTMPANQTAVTTEM